MYQSQQILKSLCVFYFRNSQHGQQRTLSAGVIAGVTLWWPVSTAGTFPEGPFTGTLSGPEQVFVPGLVLRSTQETPGWGLEFYQNHNTTPAVEDVDTDTRCREPHTSRS